MTKKILILIISLLTITFFLSIQIAYNSSPPSPLFYLVKENISNLAWLKTNPFDTISSNGVNLGKLSSQIVWAILFLVIASFLKNKFWLLVASLFLMFIWLKNYIFYGGIMDSEIYVRSSILFLISISVLNIFNFFYKEKSFSNS